VNDGLDLSETLATLVGFATESRHSNLALIDWCAQRARDAGGAVTILPGEPDRANLLARFGPERVGGVLLSAHTDVVPAGEGWSSDPYALRVDGSQIYGRGTADMKGFLAAALTVIAGQDVTSFGRPLYLALSYDEEVGCVGVRGLLEHIDHANLQPDLVVVGEPTSLRPCVAHSGKIAYRITVMAAAGHSSRSRRQPSAISAALGIWAAIDDLQRREPPSIVARRPGPRAISTNIGTIVAGVGLNVLAPYCTFDFELRSSADLDADALLEPVWAAVAAARAELAPHAGDVVVEELHRYPGMLTDPDAPLMADIVRLAGADGPGGIDYGTEGGLYAEAMPATVVIFGPGDIADAHRPDEFVDQRQLGGSESFLRQLIGQLL